MNNTARHRHHSMRVVAGGAIKVIAQIASLLLGVILMAYLTRRLGVAEYGRYAVSIQLIGWIGMLMNFATAGVTVRLVAGLESGRAYAITLMRGASLVSLLLVSLLLATASEIARLLNSPEIDQNLIILCFNLLIIPQNAIYSGILVAHNRILLSSIIMAGSMLLQLAAAVLLVEAGMAGEGACLALVAAQFITCITGRIASGVSLFEHTTIGFREVWSKARFITGTQIGLHMSHGIDLIALKLFTGDASATGWYAGAKNISQASAMLFGPSTGVVLQSISKDRLHGRMEQAAHLAEFYARVGLIYAGLLASLSVLSRDIMVFLLGPAFSAAAPVLIILLLVSGLRIFSIMGNALLGATGDRKSALLFLFAMIPATLAGYALIIPRGGMIGAAMVTMITAGLIALVLITQGMRSLKACFPFKTGLRVIAAGLATALLAPLFPGSADWVIAKLAGASLLYLAVLRLLREWSSSRATLAFFAQSFGSHFGSSGKAP